MSEAVLRVRCGKHTGMRNLPFQADELHLSR
jgi:hypothetical protein